MRIAMVALTGSLLAACGEPSLDETAMAARENAAQRNAAQEGRVLNPEALTCIRASSSDAEWTTITAEGPDAPGTLQTVLARESTARCFSINNVVIYI